jgi:hypothetical protein
MSEFASFSIAAATVVPKSITLLFFMDISFFGD